MDNLLSVVEDVFEIQGRGCVLFPGIPLNTSRVVKVRDPIRLLRPDGSAVETCIAGIEILGGAPPTPRPTPILLPPEFHKSDVPLGTRIFLT